MVYETSVHDQFEKFKKVWLVSVLVFCGGLAKAESPYPIVLIHGLASKAAVWDSEGLLDHFRSLGFTEGGSFGFELGLLDTLADVTLDEEKEMILDTHGDIWRLDFSNGPLSTSNMAAVFLQAKALQLAIRRIGELTGKQKVILIGHSMGGLAAATYLVYGDPNKPGVTFLEENERLANPISVAKLITLGTPFGGAGLESLIELAGQNNFVLLPNAFRDLSNELSGHTNVLLEGGAETDLPLLTFASRDVNCDGVVDGSLKGINHMVVGEDWPLDIDYFCIVGTQGLIFNWDCIVGVDDQYLPFAKTRFIEASHTCGIPCFAACCEVGALDPIIEAMDEPDGWASAYELTASRWTEGFLTRYDSQGTDDDYFYLELTGPTIVELRFLNQATREADLAILDGVGTPLELYEARPANGELTVNLPISSSGPTRRIIKVSGFAQPSEAMAPCASTCVECRDPYRLYFADLGASNVHLTASSVTVGPGQSTTLSALVRAPDGTSPVPGVEVTFQSTQPGVFGNCPGSGTICSVLTDLQGVAMTTFSPSSVGSVNITARAGSGGLDAVTLAVAAHQIAAQASPDPVAVNLPATLGVTVTQGDGSPPPPGTQVTFSTTYPGVFSGNGATSISSPSTVLTDASGSTWIRFASSVVGTAYLTIESIGASAIVPVAIYNPNGNLTIALSVGFISGSTSEATYEIEALVTNENGLPVSGQRVDFTASQGALSTDHDFTGPTGIADTRLTVNASGDVTVTADADGILAATTFHAQVGEPMVETMIVKQSFPFGDEVLGVAYTEPDGNILIAGDYDGTIKAWNTADWSLRWMNAASDDRASQVSISPDGTKVLMAHREGVDVFNVDNGNFLCSVSNAESRGIHGAFIGNDSFFETSFYTLYRHSSICGNGVNRYTLPEDHEFQGDGHLDFDPIKGRLAATTDEGRLFVWDTGGNLVTQQQIGSSQNAYDTDFSQDGSKLIVAGGLNGLLKSFNTTTWTSSSITAQNVGSHAYSTVFIDMDRKIAVGGVGKVEVMPASGGASTRIGNISGNAFEMAWNQEREELAVGASGNTLYIFKPLEPIDRQDPIITVSAPQEGIETNQPTMKTSGSATDNVAVVTFTINGKQVDLDENGFFCDVVNLAEGLNTIEYQAWDAAGNDATVTRHVSLVLDHIPPSIFDVLISPASGQPGQTFALEAGVIDGDSGVAAVTARVEDQNGNPVGPPIPMSPLAGNKYACLIETTGYSPGFYTVDIAATDSSAQANMRTLEAAAGFEIEPPPALSISSAELNFGGVMLGFSATLDLAISNAGGGVLEGMGTTSPPFSILSGGSYQLAQNESSTMSIRFEPTAPGELTKTLVLSGGGGGMVPLKGVGIEPPNLDVTVHPGTTVPLGLDPVVLEADLAWGWPPISLEWTIDSGPDTGYSFGLDQNPIFLESPHPIPDETTVYRLSATDQRETVAELVHVLVSANPEYRDFDGDGVNTLFDLWALMQFWGELIPDNADPNGDGRMDVRDFLYIDTGLGKPRSGDWKSP